MELFAADGHDAGGCERVTGKSGMRPLELRPVNFSHDVSVAKIVPKWVDPWGITRKNTTLGRSSPLEIGGTPCRINHLRVFCRTLIKTGSSESTEMPSAFCDDRDMAKSARKPPETLTVTARLHAAHEPAQTRLS